jgi:acyl carrier protein
VNDTRSKVREVITRQFGIEPQLLTDETTLDDLGADSMAIVELMVNLEEIFDAPMPDVTAANINTVGEIISFIEKNNASSPPDLAREASL